MISKPRFQCPLAILVISLFVSAVAISAQNPMPTPRQERLLNGLKVLMWNDPKADHISLKVRVNAGSAFDPQGKEGVMKILAAHLLPTADAREFFTDELGGSVEVVTNFDYIQINATSRPDKLLDLLETVSNAINNLNVDKESVARFKAEQVQQVQKLAKDPVYAADLAASTRLLGTFPYGRAQNGTIESLGRVDFADVLFAKERFFTADNATVAISGSFDQALAYRALRRFFGNWLKADKKVPTAFRQPDEPDTKLLSVKLDSPGNTQARYAMRGIARNDKDYVAAEILERILQGRLTAAAAKQNASEAFVRSESHVLPGVLLFGYTVNSDAVPNLVSQVMAAPVTAEEFSRAKAEASEAAMQRAPADWWLDAETYKIASVADDMRAAGSVTAADVQRVLDRLAKNPMVAVSVVPAATSSSN